MPICTGPIVTGFGGAILCSLVMTESRRRDDVRAHRLAHDLSEINPRSRAQPALRAWERGEPGSARADAGRTRTCQEPLGGGVETMDCSWRSTSSRSVPSIPPGSPSSWTGTSASAEMKPLRPAGGHSRILEMAPRENLPQIVKGLKRPRLSEHEKVEPAVVVAGVGPNGSPSA